MKLIWRLLLLIALLALVTLGLLFRIESQFQTHDRPDSSTLQRLGLGRESLVGRQRTIMIQEEHAEYDGTYVVEGGWGTLKVHKQLPFVLLSSYPTAKPCTGRLENSCSIYSDASAS